MMRIKLNPAGVYEARWTVHVDGKPRSMRKSLRTQVMAEAEAALAALLNGEEPEREKATVAQAVDIYIEQHLRPRRQDGNVSGAAVAAIKKAMGALPIEAVTDDVAAGFIRERGRDVQPQTVRKEMNFLQAALNFAVKRGLAKVGPFSLSKPPDGPPRDLWMTEAQESKMLAALPKESLDLQVFVRLALAYGVRCQALLDLTWGQVDFDRGQINFNRQGARLTRKRRPIVPMTDSIRDLLRRKRAEGGTAVINRNAPAHFKRFATGLGLGWVTPHILKHTAVTLLLRSGQPVATVAALTATDPRTLTKTYHHHGRDQLLAAAGRNDK